jgi:hypothetical protein
MAMEAETHRGQVIGKWSQIVEDENQIDILLDATPVAAANWFRG